MRSRRALQMRFPSLWQLADPRAGGYGAVRAALAHGGAFMPHGPAGRAGRMR
jgi:hypothetical protein